MVDFAKSAVKKHRLFLKIEKPGARKRQYLSPDLNSLGMPGRTARIGLIGSGQIYYLHAWRELDSAQRDVGERTDHF